MTFTARASRGLKHCESLPRARDVSIPDAIM